MQVVKNLKAEILGTNTYYFDIDRYHDPLSDEVIVYGYDSLEHKLDLSGFKKKKYLNVTMPTEFCSNQDISLDNDFDIVYTICPYSAEWLNKIKNTNKYKTVWYPFNESYEPEKEEKLYDVCYHGGIHGSKYTRMLEIMIRFNYRYMTMRHGINTLTRKCLPYATDMDLSFQEKLRRVSQSKISICYNSFPVRGESDLINVKSKQLYSDNQAFSHIEDLGIIPQLKSRFIEAAYSKTLNLVERDPWNVIEKWYVPGKHFVYFDGNDHLDEKIKEILANWDKYKVIAEECYEYTKSMYSIQKFIEKIST